jgi:RNA polymerase sigma-70 factor (ECF subfamily)
MITEIKSENLAAVESIPYKAKSSSYISNLIDSLKSGNEKALQALMKLYKKKIYSYLYLLLKDRETAEELAQDTFVKAYFKANTLKTNNIRPWLYKIATNLARTEWRKNKISKHHSLPDSYRELFTFEPDYEAELLTSELINSLEDKYRIPFLLKNMDNFSYEDIAIILKKPLGTVKSLVFRAKSKLKTIYRNETGK